MLDNLTNCKNALLRRFDPEYIPQRQGDRQTMKTTINKYFSTDQPDVGLVIPQAPVPANDSRIALLEIFLTVLLPRFAKVWL
jgi:hypothetical protein